MKVKQEKGTFRPVVITLETEEELNALIKSLYYAPGCLNLFERLDNIQKEKTQDE
jgi:coenzyme F420-reducing hydrogenase beta subunit